MSSTSETWREIAMAPGYSVSDLGRVRRDATDRILSARTDSRGYMRVGLYIGDEKKTVNVHRLVALAFLGEPSADDMQVNHIDGDKANNQLANLEWATPRENVQHLHRTGLKGRPKKPRTVNPQSNLNNLVGQIFGRWEVIARAGSVKRNGRATWLCRCECGVEKVVQAGSLESGRSRSCGCLHKELMAKQLRERSVTHGLSKTKTYRAWNQMNQRCHNPSNPTYVRYGALGVTVCERWRESFANFLADMGEVPNEEMTLDRIDPAGNYEPGNCRWLHRSLQSANRKNVRRFLYAGEELTIPELSARTGIREGTLRARLIQGGWTVEEATTTDPKAYHHKD